MTIESRHSPLVTVLLPVRNGERWLGKCLTSLTDQEFRDFEVLLIDDGCTDNSIGIARSFGSLRMRIIDGPQRGLARALALGVEESRGQFIARQDHDDLSNPYRLQKQVEFLQSEPNVVAVGTQAREINEGGNVGSRIAVPLSDRAIRLHMTLFNPFVHSSVMMRREAALRAGNYRAPTESAYPEDFDLWVRLAACGELRNLRQVLVQYRKSGSSVTAAGAREIGCASALIAVDNLARSLRVDQLDPRDAEIVGFFHWRTRRISVAEAVRISVLLALVRIRAGWLPAPRGLRWRVFLAPWAWIVCEPRESRGRQESP